ncbi:glycoside hydrolase family 3 N-terminal domain-containing protein [Frigidibacter sp. MR17.24]|uniref:glycoside hydrolase family 3 N-terminal domain-containing protein n=1 Tax=Frigidibacter sp. MR17.24 TaxID=3127345 RepID=UPI003012D494
MPDDQLTVLADADEAISLTTGADYWTSIAAPAHGLRALRFADGPHGLRLQNDDEPDHLGIGRSLPATCFPPATTLASSWDIDLIAEVAAAHGREARAQGVDVVLGPGLNLKRSPLCGRNFEYYSEDPLLSGTLAAAYVRGLQGQGVAACVKHFIANNQEDDRLRVSVEADERTLREMYLKGFEIAVKDGGAWAVMSSYNRVNGTHVAENRWLLTEVLRDDWGFDGVVVSDWGGGGDPARALAAGLDIRMPGRQDDQRLRAAHAAGRVDDARLLETVNRFRTLAARTAQGAATAPDHDAHHALVRKAAAQSAVLLSNDGTLPLDLSAHRRIAVIGELARTPRFQGAGSSFVNARQPGTGALEALTAAAAGAEVVFAPGYSLHPGTDSTELIAAAADLAASADLVILVLGLPDAYDAEGRDRSTIALPPDQLALLDRLQGIRAPKAVALCNGGAVTTHGWRDSVGAIVEFWLTGQAHGEVIADILTGAVNPSGKLPETLPERLEDTPAFLNFPGEHQHVTYGEGIFVGYRWYDARRMAVDFPFGHGLSYTTFDHADLAIEVHAPQDDIAFTARLTVTNTGPRHGAEVVQLYLTDHDRLMITPPQELRGWAKVDLASGESRRVAIPVRRDRLTHWHMPSRAWVHQGGAATVRIGSSSRDIRCEAMIELPGRKVAGPLTPWSTLGEWQDHAAAGPLLAALIDSRGGIRGRMGDLLATPAGFHSVRSVPIAAIAEFPGVPFDVDDLHPILDQVP